MSPEKKYSISRHFYVFGQYIMILVYIQLAICIAVDLSSRKDYMPSNPEAVKKINLEIGLLSAIVVLGLLKQPFAWVGLLRKKLALIFIGSLLENVCNIICIFAIFKYDKYICFFASVHLLAAVVTTIVLPNLRQYMRKTEYVITKSDDDE